MSTARRVDAFAGADGQLRAITDADCLEYDLGKGYRLEVHGQPSVDGRPLQYRVVDEPTETLFTAFDPPVGIFESDALVERYAGVIEDLVHAEGADRFREIVAEFGADYRNGRLLVVAEKVAELIRATLRVEYNPENTRPWEVYFVDDDVRSDFGMDRVQIAAEQWADDHPHAILPDTFGYLPGGDTWRQLRLIWTLMYARDANVEIDRPGE